MTHDEGRREPRWLNRPITEAIHGDLLRQHGGAAGVRDEGLLESALDRPRNRWHYDGTADAPELAAAYGAGIARNHAFLDGNKRTAFQVMYVFLGLNRLRIVASEPEVVALMIDVATGALDEPALARWIREHVAPRS